MTPEDIHLLWGQKSCFFLFWFTFYRDLPDDGRYLPDNKRHLCVRFHANMPKVFFKKNSKHFYNLQKPTPHEYPFFIYIYISLSLCVLLTSFISLSLSIAISFLNVSVYAYRIPSIAFAPIAIFPLQGLGGEEKKKKYQFDQITPAFI